MEINKISPEQYAIESAICDKAQAYAESIMGGKRNYLTAEEARHSDYSACDNDMRGRVEQYRILTDLPPIIQAYIGKQDGYGFPVTVWTGLPIGRAYPVGSWHIRSHIGSRMYAFHAIIGGKKYHGRGFGSGMCITLRACK